MGNTMKDVDEFKEVDSYAESCGVLRFVLVLFAALLCLMLFVCPISAFAQSSSVDLVSDDVYVNKVESEEGNDPASSSQGQKIEASDFAVNAVGQMANLVALSSSSWTQNGTCEWMMDESTSTMTVRPIAGRISGELDSLPWNPDSIRGSLQCLKFEGRVILPPVASTSVFIGHFGRMYKLKEIRGIEFLDTSKITDMAGMFSSCGLLQELDLSSFDTSNVVSMKGMFASCSSLQRVNISSFRTSKVTDMGSMFAFCSSLQDLDLSNFDVSNVVELTGYYIGDLVKFSIFYDCKSLKTLTLGNFSTPKVTDMSELFKGCSSLESLDLSGFDTSNSEDMSGLFSECSALRSLDLSNFKTSKVKDMSFMFSGCTSLTSLNVSSFDTRNVKKVFDMFAKCGSLERLDISSFDTANVDECVDMFAEANKLSSISIGSKFTLQNTFPLGTWTNEKGESFGSFSIPRNVAGVYVRRELVPTPYAIVLGETQGETYVTVGDDPFWVSSPTSKLGIDGVHFISEDPQIATVDKYGLVTVHLIGLNCITSSFDYFADHEEMTLRVEVERFPSVADSDVGVSLCAMDSFSAKKLDGCSFRTKRSSLLNDRSTTDALKAYMGNDARILDILDFDIIGPNGSVFEWNEPDHPLWICFDPGYLYEYFEPRWSWSIDFVQLNDGKVGDVVHSYWYRDVEELAFEPTHLSTYAVVATPVSDDDTLNGGNSGSSNASQNGTRVSGDPSTNKLAQTGDVLGFGVFAIIELIMIAVGITLIARPQTLRSKE